MASSLLQQNRLSAFEQALLHRCRRMQIEQHDPRFLVAIAVAPHRLETGERGADQFAAIARRHRQMHRPRRAVLRLIRFETIGFDEHHKVRCRQMLPAQLFSRTRRIRGDRFAHVCQCRHRPPEGARRHDAFAVGNFLLESEARHVAQFERQAHGDDTQTFADQPQISALEIEQPALRPFRRLWGTGKRK
jgi:hypothetical protein